MKSEEWKNLFLSINQQLEFVLTLEKAHFNRELSEVIKKYNPQFSDWNNVSHQIQQLSLTVVMAAVTNAYEEAKKWCNQNNKLNLFISQPWYEVFRIVRNAFSHNFKIEFTECIQKEKLKWEDIDLTGLNKKELSLSVVSVENSLKWLD